MDSVKPTAPKDRFAYFKRIAAIAVGWLLVVLGVAGLFLPFLQGILFLLIGLVILSKEYRWARKLLTRLRSRFPRLDASLAKAHEKAAGILGHRKGKQAR
jgi:uncharacterized membrane protein YbaN (DUF454 family)